MAKSETQTQLLLEKQKHRQLLRRRLVGTGALLVATFLLWEIGGEAPPQEIRDVPALETVFPDAQREVADAVSATAPAADTVIESGFAAAIAAVSATVSPTMSAAAPAEKVSEESEEKEETAATEIAEATDTAERESDARVVATAAADSTATAAKNFVIQIGAYSTRVRAESVVEKVKSDGLTGEVQPPVVRGEKKLWRVWVVNFASRAEARAAQIQLEKSGYAGARLFSPPAVDTAAEAPPPPESESAQQAAEQATENAAARYQLRVGAFRERANAERAVRAAREVSKDVRIEEVSAEGNVLFRVVATGFVSSAAGEQARRQLVSAGYPEVLLLKENDAGN